MICHDPYSDYQTLHKENAHNASIFSIPLFPFNELFVDEFAVDLIALFRLNLSTKCRSG